MPRVIASAVFILAFCSLYLSVVGQVVGTVHELLQGATRPVGALVARGQLLGRGGSAVAHVQGGFPRGASLHVPPLAEVSRHWVPQQSDVVELPVGVNKEGEKEGEKFTLTQCWKFSLIQAS